GAASAQCSRPSAGVGPRGDTKTDAQDGYRRAKQCEARRDGNRESERFIVPLKRGNVHRTDPAEGRRRRVAEPLEGNMAGASEPDPVLTKRQRLAELAKQSPEMGFTSLAHHIDLRWLHEAFLRTRRDGAVGVDGQTAADYLA